MFTNLYAKSLRKKNLEPNSWLKQVFGLMTPQKLGFSTNIGKKLAKTLQFEDLAVKNFFIFLFYFNLKHSFYYETEVYFSDMFFFFSLHHSKCQIAFDKIVSNILVQAFKILVYSIPNLVYLVDILVYPITILVYSVHIMVFPEGII